MISKESMGQKIKEARQNYSKKIGIKFTSSDLAHKTGLSRGYIGDLEAGRTKPSMDALELIANACDLKISWFFDELPDELKDLNIEYITVTKELMEQGLSPEQIRKIAEITKIVNKDK